LYQSPGIAGDREKMKYEPQEIDDYEPRRTLDQVPA
jgi:hypothetical protein